MERKKTKNKNLILSMLVFVFAWLSYSFSFFNIYQEAAVFATEGAQPIVQILEILNYRGEELKPMLIIFFTLVSLSLLFEIYLFLYTKKNKLSKISVVTFGLIFLLLLGINLVNKLFPFLMLLISVSILIMISIAITVNYLYIDKYDEQESNNLINGPFKSLSKAENYASKKVSKLRKKNDSLGLHVTSIIDLELDEGYYVTICIEEMNIRGNDYGKNNE